MDRILRTLEACTVRCNRDFSDGRAVEPAASLVADVYLYRVDFTLQEFVKPRK
jgi:hypothetical protein